MSKSQVNKKIAASLIVALALGSVAAFVISNKKNSNAQKTKNKKEK